MKISVWIPKGTERVQSQLTSELSTAFKIQDKTKRESTTNALRLLINLTKDEPYLIGWVLVSDGAEVIGKPYEGKAKLFRADKEYIFPDKG